MITKYLRSSFVLQDDSAKSFSTEPDFWPGECTTGRSQSPIDIPISDNVRSSIRMDPIVFENYEKIPKSDTVTNLGLSLELTVQPTKPHLHPKVRMQARGVITL